MIPKEPQQEFDQDGYSSSRVRASISFRSLEPGLEVVIKSKHLIARSYRKEDFENCMNLYSNPRLMKYFDYGNPLNPNELKALINERSLRFRQANKPFGLFSVFNKADRSFVGQFDLLPLEEPRTAEIGCILLQEHQNKGICRELCEAFLFDYIPMINQKSLLFTSEEIPIRKIIGTVHPKNYPSKRNLEALGMVCFQEKQRFNHPRFWYAYNVPEDSEDA